jgi:hypothetical protein
MRGLDCSSLSTAYASLEPPLEMDQSQIRAKLKEYSIDDFFRRYGGRPPASYRELVLQHVTGGAPIRSPDLVMWFHATRVTPGTSFSEGLRTLPERAEAIEALLRSLIPSCLGSGFMPPSDMSSWAQQGGRQHGAKQSQRGDWGPDAFLVRDAIFERDASFHETPRPSAGRLPGPHSGSGACVGHRRSTPKWNAGSGVASHSPNARLMSRSSPHGSGPVRPDDTARARPPAGTRVPANGIPPGHADDAEAVGAGAFHERGQY